MKGVKVAAMLIATGIIFSGCAQIEKTSPVNSTSFKNLTVTPHMEEPIKGDKNILYCSTFQLAWNELKDNVIKGDIRFNDNEPDIVSHLNKELSTKKDLSDKDYVAMVGFGKDSIVNKINEELKKKFSREAPTVKEKLNPEDIFAYAFLYKDLKFEHEFEKLKEPISFNGTNGTEKVKGFGIRKYGNGEKFSNLAKQVSILDYNDDSDFLIKLESKSNKDEIILAKVAPKDTLLQTIDTVEDRLRTAKRSYFGENDTLQIPSFDFNIDHKYTELLDKRLKNSGFEDYEIVAAQQSILFKLNEKGATLKSEAKLLGTKSAAAVDKPKKLIFDKPFLLMLKEKDAAYPYFALWVQNGELLVRN